MNDAARLAADLRQHLGALADGPLAGALTEALAAAAGTAAARLAALDADLRQGRHHVAEAHREALAATERALVRLGAVRASGSAVALIVAQARHTASQTAVVA